MTRNLSASVIGSTANAEVVGLPLRQDPSHQRGEAGEDVYPVGGWRGAVGSVVEPFSESSPDGGESAREAQGGDDGVPASALGGYGSERPDVESSGMRLAEMRHPLSRRAVNLATFGWEARSEPPATLRFLYSSKMPEKPRAFQVPKPVSGQTRPKAHKGRGLGWRALRARARLCGRDARAPGNQAYHCKPLMGEG